MAAQTVYTDDVTPSITDNVHEITVTVRDAGGRVTERFALDLGDDNAKALHKALGKFRTAGRDMPLATKDAANPNGESGKIRTWAVANGYKVSERGALPKDVKDAFNAAHGEDTPTDQDDSIVIERLCA